VKKDQIESGKYFESQDPNEEIILVIRKHPLVLASSFFAGIMIIISTIFLYLMLSYLGIISGEKITAVAVLFVYFVLLFTTILTFNGWLVKYLDILILTTKHLVVIKQDGLFKRGTSVLDLASIQDIAVKQTGVFQTFFNFGEIVIQTAGEIPNFVYSGVANPSKIKDIIRDTRGSLKNKQ